MYLKDRRSIVLNHNPFALFKEDPRNPSQVSHTHLFFIYPITCRLIVQLNLFIAL